MTHTAGTPTATEVGASLAIVIMLLVPAGPLALSTVSDSTDAPSAGIGGSRRDPLQRGGGPVVVTVSL